MVLKNMYLHNGNTAQYTRFLLSLIKHINIPCRILLGTVVSLRRTFVSKCVHSGNREHALKLCEAEIEGSA